MSYKFSVFSTEHFTKQVKFLKKKYPSIKNDIAGLISLLIQDPMMGDPVGKNCYKIRLRIPQKVKEKRGCKSYHLCKD